MEPTMTHDVTMSPEQYALGVLRRHRDSMTRPDFQIIGDDAALTAREVERLWEQLLADRVPKPLDRPRAAPAPVQAAQTPGPVEAPPSWLTAKEHPSAKVRRLYTKAVDAVAALEAALAAELERDKLRDKQTRLERELAKVRAELQGGVPKVRSSSHDTDRVPCPGCGKDFAGGHGIVMHRTRTGCGAHTIQVAN